jgi:type VI protein secretion system component VasK
MARDATQERHDFLIYVIGRPLMLVFWSLILWGTFYGCALLYAVILRGPTVALKEAMAGRDRLAGVGNLTLTACAVVVWSFVGVAVWTVRRARRRRAAVLRETTLIPGGNPSDSAKEQHGAE